MRIVNIKEDCHPCFEGGCKKGRIHLPVAPICNVQCNYCKRDFDCINESRPGVSSHIMTPEEACEYFEHNINIYDLAVAGIAGPGDSLANWSNVKKTFNLIKNVKEDISFCLSTNGLLLPELATEIKDVGVEYVTVTVNSLDKEIAAEIYDNVVLDGVVKTGYEAADCLIEKQREGMSVLSDLNIKTKINFVLIPGINESQIEVVAKFAAQNRVAIMNIIPLIPIKGTKFGELKVLHLYQELKNYQSIAAEWVPVMKHCTHCRADAVGYL